MKRRSFIGTVAAVIGLPIVSKAETTPDVPTINPNRPGLLAFHRSQDKFRRLIGDRQTGKTNSCAGEFAAMMTGRPILGAPQTFTRCKRGLVIGADRYGVAFMYKRLCSGPAGLVSKEILDVTWEDKSMAWPREVRLRNGGVIQFESAILLADSRMEKLRGLTIDVVWADEVEPHYLPNIYPTHSSMWSLYYTLDGGPLDKRPFVDFRSSTITNPPTTPTDT